MVVGGTQYQDAVNLIVALQQLDFQPKMAAFSTAPTNPEFPAAIGDKPRASCRRPATRPHASSPSNQEFVDYYTELNGTPPGRGRGQRLDHRPGRGRGRRGARAAPTRPECQQQLIDFLRDNEVETVVGPLSWDADGRPESAHLIQQYVDGKIQIVLPEEPPRPSSSPPSRPGDLRCPGPLLLQSLILGVLLGGLYALLAAGLTLYFGVMRVVMIAHSAFLILAAYLAWFFHRRDRHRPAALPLGHRAAVLPRRRGDAAAAARPGCGRRR